MNIFNKGDQVVLLIDVDSCYSWADAPESAVALADMGEIGIIAHVDDHTVEDLADDGNNCQAAVFPDNCPGIRLNMLLTHIRKLPEMGTANTGCGYASHWKAFELVLYADCVYPASHYELHVSRDNNYGEDQIDTDWQLIGWHITDLPITADPVECREFLGKAWAHFWKGLSNG